MAVGEPRLGRTPFRDRLRPDDLDQLLTSSRRVVHPAGALIFQPGDPDQAAIVESGLARLYISASSGTQATVLYAQPGELLGVLLIMSYDSHGSAQVIAESVLTHLNVDNVRRLMATNVAIAAALAGVLAARYEHAIRTIAIHVFGSVGQRVAFDILNRASRGLGITGRLETNATQQELADGIGAARESVARAMTDLRERGFIDTSPRRIRVIDPARLEEFASALSSPS